MIYSRSTEYAIRALIALALVPDARYIKADTIAKQENIPACFLARILQQLARKGLLRSRRGPQGGFALNLLPEQIRLLDIVEALGGSRGGNNYFQVQGLISPDNLVKVVRQMNKQVNRGRARLSSTNSLRITKKG